MKVNNMKTYSNLELLKVYKSIPYFLGVQKSKDSSRLNAFKCLYFGDISKLN